MEPDTHVCKKDLHEEKRKIYEQLLKTSRLELMEGASQLLTCLAEKGTKRAVVTNSSRAHIEIIKASFPILQSIPLWICREDYSEPKPSPQGYLTAMRQLAEPNDKIVGFEDTLKGVKALLAAGVESFLVCPEQSEHVAECLALGAKHLISL